MLAIGPWPTFPPEMIAMATWRSCSTPYGAYSVAESAEWPVTEGSAADEDSPAASAIGKTGRKPAGSYPPRIWPECGRVGPSRNDGIDSNHWFGAAPEARAHDRAESAP